MNHGRIVFCAATAAVAFALSAVSVADDMPSPNELFSAVNRAFVGRQFDAVVMRYGQPAGQVPYGQLVVYQFQASNTVRLHEPVRGAGWQGYNQQMQCMMRVGVKSDGTVDGLDFVGKMGACQVFMP